MLPVLKEGSSPLSVFRMKLNVAGISPVMTLAYPTWRGHHGVLPKLYRQNGLIPYCSGLKLKSRTAPIICALDTSPLPSGRDTNSGSSD